MTKVKEYTLNRAGNLQDVQNSIKCNWERITINDLKRALKDERKNQKRSSFIKYLGASIKRKQRETITRIIHFEDHGQDFLRWHLNSEGRIVKSQPCQIDFWNPYTVINHDVPVIEFAMIKRFNTRTVITIKYPVIKVEEVTNG